MYGWRARIGMMIPHVNTVIEAEYWRLAPPGVSFHTTRMRSAKGMAEELRPLADDEIERAARDLAELNAAVICFCCTSRSLARGVGHDTEIMERIRAVTGTPAISTSFAVVQALRSLGVSKVAVATPYTDAVNDLVVRFLLGNGIQVTRIRGLGHGPRLPLCPLSERPVSHTGLQDPSVTYNLARGAMTPDAEAIFISCNTLRTVDVLDALEQDLGVPAVSSNQATLWLALRTAGVRAEIPGYGRLLHHLAM